MRYTGRTASQIGELFKIRNKKITRVEAVLLSVPYGMPSGWSTH